VKEENKFFTLDYDLTSLASRDLTKSGNSLLAAFA
jgi:hypothetical protein